MYNKQFKKIALLLIIGSFAGTVVAQAPTDVQTLLKLGDNPYTINDKAALEVESTTRGFLPPRMTRLQRNAIVAPVAGLQIWCTDCNGASGPYIYTGTAWATIASSVAKSTLTTGKISDTNAPIWLSTSSATIKGVLVQPSQALPTETGIVLKEIIGNDFASLPYLDAAGNNTTTVFKTATTLPVTTAGGAITKDITLNPSNSTNPFYFSTYAKTPLGVDYGNPVVFNCADPVITTEIDVATNGSLMPIFKGTLKVNAGTPKGAVTEYGYYVGTTNAPTNKVPLSTSTSFDALNASLDKETFTANPDVINLEVNNYFVESLGTYYLQFYAIVSGRLVKSPVKNWYAAADPVTGGTAVATYVSVGALTPALNFGVPANSDFPVVFNVKKIGSYAYFDFYNASKTGATTGLSSGNIAGGTFDVTGNQIINFRVSGTPRTSLEGNVFKNVTRLSGVIFNTGPMPTAYAVCDGTSPTAIVEVTGPSGRIWMDRNLGASAAAESIGDIRAFGCLYQWGRGNDGHANITWGATGVLTNGKTTILSPTTTPGHNKFIASATTSDWTTASNDHLWKIDNTNNPCPSGFRLPTSNEANADFGNFGVTNPADGFAMLKLTVSGWVSPDGSLPANLYEQDLYYWSGQWTSGNTSVFFRMTPGVYRGNGIQSRLYGFQARCIKDTPPHIVSTGKKSEARAPVWLSSNSATIKGTLVNNNNIGIYESGIIYKEITNDYTTYPVFPNTGDITPPVYRSLSSTAVSANNDLISATISGLTATNPYYFRAYTKMDLGSVSYGDPVIFNVAPPKFTGPTATAGTPKPTFAGTLTVNAGTAQNVVPEYGYYVGTTNPPTNKVVLSTPATITSLNNALLGETFTANTPAINLPVVSYTVTPNVVNYFNYYVIANGVTTKSTIVSFTPTGL